jgi:hypothetical protein
MDDFRSRDFGNRIRGEVSCVGNSHVHGVFLSALSLFCQIVRFGNIRSYLLSITFYHETIVFLVVRSGMDRLLLCRSTVTVLMNI